MKLLLRPVLGAVLPLLQAPPEPGAPEGLLCAEVPPAPSAANPACELRRMLRVMIHEGRALELLTFVDPLLEAVLGYILGAPPAAAPHLEVAQVMAGMCQQSVTCQMRDSVDLGLGLVAFLREQDAHARLLRVEHVLANPQLETFFERDASGNPYVGEDGMVAMVELLLPAVRGMEDPAQLRETIQPMLAQMPEALRAEVEAGLGDLEALLSPTREPNVLRPLQRVLTCYAAQDEDRALVRMLYQLLFVVDAPELRPASLASLLRLAREVDSRGTLVTLIQPVLEALREDEGALDAAAVVCRALTDTRTPASGGRSPAELALPDLQRLFADGLAAEAVCLADSLIHGCSGGARPACAGSP